MEQYIITVLCVVFPFGEDARTGKNSVLTMKFVLKQYNTELISFDLRSEGLDGFVCTILEKSEKNRGLFPLGLQLTDKGLLDWLKSRVIPRNREFVDKILSVYGLDHNNILGIVKLCMGLSVNDSYWIVPEGFEGKFKDYNLFENGFDKALSLIAWTGFGSVRPSAFSSSPEFTTNGNLRKGWRRIGGKILLYKGGSSGAANTGNEPYSEFYASQIAEAMGLNHVSYKLAKWKGTLCSTCELFTDIDHSFVPIHRCFPEKKLTEIAAELKKLGDKFHQPFCDMMVFDALVCNTDRHFGNFGLLIDNRSNKTCAFAPIFDNGMVLFPFAMEDDFRDLDAYAKTRTPVFGSSFAELAAAFITDRQRKQLRKLIGFRFTRDRSYNLPAKRLKALEDFLGFTRQHEAFLFGVGNLGGALLNDNGLSQFGLKIAGAFDVRKEIIGTEINGIPIYDINRLPDVNTGARIKIGILTVPIYFAQNVTDWMVACGIKAVWNFTPFRIRVPENIVVQNTSLYAHLAVMFNRLNEEELKR